MKMPWFKFYYEARTDRKLRSLSRDQRLVWLDLLCYAAEQSDRGIIQFDDDNLLAIEVADGDVSLLNETVEKLQALRVISVSATNATESERCTVASRCIAFLAFTKRQGGRVACNAKSSTERSRKFRSAKKLGGDATTCNDMQRDATHATTDRDREEEKKEYTDTQISERTQPVEANPVPPKGESASHQIKSQASRDPEDLALIREAEKILIGDMRTEKLAWELGRTHNIPGMIKIHGWKWVRAAEKMVGPGVTDSQRRTFNYFATIAGNLDDSERIEAKRFGHAAPKIHDPGPPGGFHQSPKTIARLKAQAERAALESVAS